MTDDLRDFRHSREFFETKVPGVATWFLAIVGGLLAAALVWAAVGEIDIVVKAPAVLRPDRNVSVVKNAVAGPVDRVAFVHGARVHRGDLLWSIDTAALAVDRGNTAVQQARNAARLRTLDAFDDALRAGCDTVGPGDPEAQVRAAVHFAEVERLTVVCRRTQEAWEREKALPAGLVTAQKVDDLKSEADLARIALAGYQAQTRLKTQDERRSLLAESEALAQRSATLAGQGADAEVRAPLDGTVEALKKVNPGDYALVGEELARVVPDGAETLKVELTLDNRDIAEVQVGMPVVLRFAALPSSEYGQVTARVLTVPADATALANQTVFVVEATLGQPWLESRRGDRLALRPGMGAEARILLKRKTVLRYLLEKLDFL